MKPLACLLFLVSILTIFPVLASAAESGPTLSLSLPQAVALALRDNPDLALSQHRQQSAAIGVAAAQSRFLPSLQASAGAHEIWLQQPSPGSPDDYRNANLQLLADLNLFNGFADSASLSSSRNQLQAADADLLRQRQTVAFSVSTNFIAVLTDSELVQVADQNLQSQKALEQQISAFYQAGTRTVTDLYQQQAASAQAEFSLLDARRNLQVAQLLLWQDLGRTPPASIQALRPDTQALNDALQHLDPARVYAQALAERPDLASQKRQIAAARDQTRVARAGYLPSLDLQASTATSFNSATAADGLGGQFDDNRDVTLGLSLSIPIFDRGMTRTNVAQARIGEADATTTLLKLQQQVGQEVGQALADYQRANQQLITAGRQLDFARQALAASEARYQVGAATWIELSNARSIFVQAQADEVRARYGVLLQGLNLGYRRGDLGALLNLLVTKQTDHATPQL